MLPKQSDWTRLNFVSEIAQASKFYRAAAITLLSALLAGAPTALLPARTVEKPERTDSEDPAAMAMASVWKVRSSTSTLYLAGSVHLLRAKDHPLPPVYDAAYSDSEKLFFEVDMEEASDFQAQQRMLEMGRYSNGDTIRDHISESTYDLLRDYLKKRGIGGNLFESMKPGMLAITIASLEYMRRGASPQLGVDFAYYRKALKHGKPMHGLETSEFQLQLIGGMGGEKQEALLRDTLENLDESEETTEVLLQSWREGDAKTLEDLLNVEMSKDKEIAKALLYDRNRSWLPALEKSLRGNQNAMVVVGAGHLVGKRGVVQLLRKRGYTVTQMRYAVPVTHEERGGR